MGAADAVAMMALDAVMPQALKILFLTLEFRTGTFSGNGVYACGQVRALAAAGHHLLVVSARPAHAAKSDDNLGAHRIIEIPVSSWHRLDAGAPWREFAAGVLDRSVTEAVASFRPDYVFGVDWSALAAVRGLAPYCCGVPYVYLNYRVFSRTATGEDLELVRGMEAAAMAEALLTVALSRSDAQYLAEHVAGAALAPATSNGSSKLAAGADAEAGAEAGAGEVSASKAVANENQGATVPLLLPAIPKVLLPALREDVRQLQPPVELLRLVEAGATGAGMTYSDTAAAATTMMQSRPYLSCVVRLSPEKEPERFVAVVEAMAADGLLMRHGLTPLLLGAANDEYAQGLKARLHAAAPDSAILEQFMGPGDLAELYCQTRLNFHPSTYDAYGMTIVEAASQGAPSVVHDGGGTVGAADLLRGADGEVFLLDLAAPAHRVAAEVGRILEQQQQLAATAARALKKARSWDEAEAAAELVRLVREAAAQCRAG